MPSVKILLYSKSERTGCLLIIWEIIPHSKDPPVLKIVRRATSLRRGKKCYCNSKTLRRVLRSACFSIRAPRKGPEKWCRAKIVESVEKLFDVFWRFLTFFALRENCRKVSKNFLTLFDDFWRFLTWPLSAGPFCNLLILGKRGRKTVRIAKSYGGSKTLRNRVPYYFSPEGSFGQGKLHDHNAQLLLELRSCAIHIPRVRQYFPY